MTDGVNSFVLSGGIGSRLWPFSRADHPKQFHRLRGAHSMLRNTVRRLRDDDGLFGPTRIIASADHAQLVWQDCVAEGVLAEQCFFEPVGRNTAAAVAVATLSILAEQGDGLVLIVPADHEVTTADQFHRSVASGIDAAQSGALVVFGVKPTRPETGFGYVKTGEAAANACGVRSVERFIEKPDAEKAMRYLASGDYFWNSGMILFRASKMAEHFQSHAPDIWAGVKAAFVKAEQQAVGQFLPADLYDTVRAEAVDTAILEKAEPIALVPARFQWSDIGSWEALYELAEKDPAGNAMMGDVVALDCENCYFHNEGQLVTAHGLRDLAVVSTRDATFVAPLKSSQEVRGVFQKLDLGDRSEIRITAGLSKAKDAGANAKRVRHWLENMAFPLWAEIGPDRNHGGFHEALGFDGVSLNRPKRLRTMARQTWCFAKAQANDWLPQADTLVDHGMDWLEQSASEGVGFPAVQVHDGAILDAAVDAYDMAFVLLACASAHAAGNARALPLGKTVLQRLEDQFRDTANGAWFETADGASDKRRANPHMHLLEAFLEWHAATGCGRALSHADDLVSLFQNRFFDRDNWAVIEVLDSRFRKFAGPEGEVTEPGHHFEWAWLLGEHARQRGRNHPDEARKVYATGVSQGSNRKTGLAWASMTPLGVPIERVHRSWPQAEALKAAIMLDRTGEQEMTGEIEARMDRLFIWHLDEAPDGLWVDRRDAEGVSTAQDVPASIFYHIVGGMMAYLDHHGKLAAG
ncbi:MAG: AGE family epimerase/isomerase [Pseudomonadota bacterium]